MTDRDKIIEELAKPLSDRFVKSRSAAGANLSYLESHHVIRELNRVFGYDGWDFNVIELRNLGTATYTDRRGDEKVETAYQCEGTLTVKGLAPAKTLYRQDVGYGSSTRKAGNGGLGELHESAGKEAVSDCLKRCARTLGDIFGLALYDKEQTNVAKGESLAESEVDAKLEACTSMAEVAQLWTSLSPAQQTASRAKFTAKKEALR